MRRVEAVSKDRYRASADEKRRYGGNTVTDFYVRFADSPESCRVIRGYGPSPSERKADAVRRFLEEEAAKVQPGLFPNGGGRAT